MVILKERSILHFLKKMASSWNWFAPECSRELLDLLQNDRKSLIPGSKYEVLWHTRSKFVLLLELPDGRKVVYKAPLRIKNFYKYMLRLSPYGKEARNFRLLSKLNLPLVKLLAVGEDRSFFKLQSGFLVTEYADGYSNGCLALRDVMFLSACRVTSSAFAGVSEKVAERIISSLER